MFLRYQSGEFVDGAVDGAPVARLGAAYVARPRHHDRDAVAFVLQLESEHPRTQIRDRFVDVVAHQCNLAAYTGFGPMDA